MNIPLKWRRNGRNIAYSVFFHKLTKLYLTSLCTSPFPCKVRALTKPTLLTPILHSKLKISCLCPPFIFNTGSKPNIYYLSQLVNSILGWTRTMLYKRLPGHKDTVQWKLQIRNLFLLPLSFSPNPNHILDLSGIWILKYPYSSRRMKIFPCSG